MSRMEEAEAVAKAALGLIGAQLEPMIARELKRAVDGSNVADRQLRALALRLAVDCRLPAPPSSDPAVVVENVLGSASAFEAYLKGETP